MYIEPSSNVEFFKNIGLTPNSEDTLYFADETSKDAYFENLSGVVLNPQSYVRKDRGVLRVGVPMSVLYDVDYMRFKNTEFENKWFYAFVTGVDYVNNAVTEVSFQLDTMITWMGTFQMGECYIQRQHAATDSIGENLVPEDLELGEYTNEGREFYQPLTTGYDITVITTTNSDGDSVGGQYGGMYSGAGKLIPNDQAEDSVIDQTNDFLGLMVSGNRGDNVVTIKMLPKAFNTDAKTFYDTEAAGSSSPIAGPLKTMIKPYDTINGYTPRNNKLFTYPYKFLDLYNCEGEHLELHYEFFAADQTVENQISFIVRGYTGATSEIICLPMNYKSLLTDESMGLVIKNFPTCSWAIDAFKAYLAQYESSLPVQLLSSSANAAFAAATGNPASAGLSLAGSAVGLISQDLALRTVHPAMPTTNRGSQAGDILAAMNLKTFSFYKKSITAEFAAKIDKYFDMFGYAMRTVGFPNMNAREHWTYVKTIGANCHGNLPASDKREIESMFDRGVRFWKGHTAIGHYSTENPVLEG